MIVYELRPHLDRNKKYLDIDIFDKDARVTISLGASVLPKLINDLIEAKETLDNYNT